MDDCFIESLKTPGHSDDSVSYLLRCGKTKQVQFCFCGDLLLPAGLGNTAIAGGDALLMAQSLISLESHLIPDTVICSGHDYQQCFAINWQAQKQQTMLLNALLKNDITNEEFAKQKLASDEASTSQFKTLCGYAQSLQYISTQELNAKQAKELLKKANTYLIDTREPYEHSAADIPQLFDVSTERVINIPLSRMANALIEQQLEKQGEYVLLCRSGNRSKQAATNLSQLGYEHVYNLMGGLALFNI